MQVPISIEPTDCETCGRSYDELTIDFDDDGQWQGVLRWGCYGADSVHGTRVQLIDWLRRDAAWAIEPAVLESTIGLIEAA